MDVDGTATSFQDPRHLEIVPESAAIVELYSPDPNRFRGLCILDSNVNEQTLVQFHAQRAAPIHPDRRLSCCILHTRMLQIATRVAIRDTLSEPDSLFT